MGGQPTRQDGAAGAIRFLRPRASTWPLHGRRAPDSKLQGIADRILWTALSGSVGPRQVTLDELDDLVRLRLRDAAAALLPTWFWVVIELQGEHGENWRPRAGRGATGSRIEMHTSYSPGSYASADAPLIQIASGSTPALSLSWSRALPPPVPSGGPPAQLGVRPGRIQYTSMYAKTPLPWACS